MLANELELRSDYEAIRALRPWLETVLLPIGSERADAAIGGIELAVHEIATNCIDHADNAADTLRFLAELESGTVTIRVVDQGKCYVAQQPKSLDGEPRVRGYGLLIVEQLAQSVRHDRVVNTNVWTVVFAV